MSTQTKRNLEKVAIIDAIRTPFVKSFGVFEGETSLSLSAQLASEILNRTGAPVSALDEVIWGTVISWLKNSNLARDIVISAGLPTSIPAYTVSKACVSGMHAMQAGFDSIALGRSRLVLTGGAEVMSRVPLTFREDARKFFTKLSREKTAGARLQLALKNFHLNFLLPDAVNLTESATGLTMGEHAEIMAVKNNISRAEQDACAVFSHQKAFTATEAGLLSDEIIPIVTSNYKGACVNKDNIIRADANMSDMNKLRPAFDKKYGTITAGTASTLTDGATAVLLAADAFAKEHKLPVLGHIIDAVNIAVDPNDQLLIGPAHAIAKLLLRNNLSAADVEVYEIHEAFAAQLISCQKVLTDTNYCKTKIGLEQAFGHIPMEHINRDGGSLAYGHPLAATGGRLASRALRIARRLGKRYSVITACAAGGQAEAMLLETSEN